MDCLPTSTVSSTAHPRCSVQPCGPYPLTESLVEVLQSQLHRHALADSVREDLLQPLVRPSVYVLELQIGILGEPGGQPVELLLDGVVHDRDPACALKHGALLLLRPGSLALLGGCFSSL